MRADRIGESIEYEGHTYTVGDWYVADKRSDYSRLVGVISRLTDEEGDLDIYCDFLEPDDPEIAARLTARFCHIYGEIYAVQQILADDAVMAPDELDELIGKPPCFTALSKHSENLCRGKRQRHCYSCKWDTENNKIRKENNA